MAAGEKLKVLAVDDSEDDVELFRREIGRVEGYQLEVIAAHSIAEARSVLASSSVDALFVDHRLGPEDGTELVSELRAQGCMEAIIVLTGAGDEYVAASISRAGADDYIRKGDCTASVLKRALGNALARAQLRQAEARLQKVAQLEQSNRQLASFATVLSHDLQAPLRTLEYYVRRAKQTLATPESSANYLEQALAASGRMQQQVKDLLEYCKVGGQTQPTTGLCLEEIVAESVENLRSAIEAQPDVRIDVALDGLPAVNGARTLLVQLFQNLLGNALKFRRPEPLEIRVSGAAQRDQIEILVEDTGIGVDPAAAERIFGLFQRLPQAEGIPGSGVGLAICRRIVEQHGGSIRVVPSPPPGLRIALTLPATEVRSCEPGIAP